MESYRLWLLPKLDFNTDEITQRASESSLI